MIGKILSHPVSYAVVTAAVVFGVLVCIFPHYVPSLSWGVNYAVHLMLFFLFAGIFALFIRQPRFTFIFFGGCAFLCIFLKYSVHSNGLPRAQRKLPTANSTLPSHPSPVDFKVAHFNLSNIDSISQLAEANRALDADLITIHEVTPNWEKLLDDSLSAIYPYHHTMVDIGIFGMSIFSKHELTEVDTFYYQEIPNLKGCIEKMGEPLCFMSVQTEPALNEYSLQRLQEHLAVIGESVLIDDTPKVVLGDFNAVSWSGEIQSFLNYTKLMESRRGFMPHPFVSTSTIFQVPLDHIFFSRHLRCELFENIASSSNEHLGITGVYRLKTLEYHAKKTAQ